MSDDNRQTETATPARRDAARKRAQDHFAAAERRDTEVRKELERQRNATMNQMAKLRALRLEKEKTEQSEEAPKTRTPARAPKPRRIKV